MMSRLKVYGDINEDMINIAHRHNLRCNVFWSDDTAVAEKFLEMGVDTILTNDYNRVSRVIKS